MSEEPAHDRKLRILGPLDPVIWNRDLVRMVFGFDYVWEVYKPAAQRRWGWYVCPLLYKGQLVGRIEAAREGEDERGRPRVEVRNVWGDPPRAALRDALGRLTTMQARRAT